LIKEYFKRR